MSQSTAPRATVDRVKELLSFAEGLLSLEETGLMAFDTNLHLIFWSPLIENMSAMSSADMFGCRFLEVLPFLERTAADTHLQKALLGQKAVVRTVHQLPSDAGQREGFFDGYFSPLTGEHDEVIGAVVLLHDVTEQTIVEQRLRETEGRFRTMADAAPVLLWMSGLDSLCTFFNETWLSFTGRTLAQEWGVGWAEGIYFEDFQRCMDTYIAAFTARSVFELEYRLRRHDGEYRWILGRGMPRYLPDGTFAGYIGSCIDITDKKRVEAELRKAVRDRDDFLSIASHELRTPLTTLQLEVENLQRSLGKQPHTDSLMARLGRSVETTAAQTARLIRLVEELLDTSRLAAGLLRLQPSGVDLGELVKEVVLRSRSSLQTADCPVELNLDDKVVGCWDRLRIEQVTNNLLSNAVKYGAGKPIAINVSRQGKEAVLAMKDLGIGVAPEDQARIFRKFERAVPAANYGGFGLGLWITHEITTAHGGSIRVDSVLGGGATFTVRLPLAPDKAETTRSDDTAPHHAKYEESAGSSSGRNQNHDKAPAS